MKQRISIDQLQELTDEQKDKLREWWEPKRGDWYSLFSKARVLYNADDVEDYYYPLLSIGQMIEIIETEEYPTLHIDKDLKKGIMESDRYRVFQQGRGTCAGNSLCDALWQAVKEVL